MAMIDLDLLLARAGEHARNILVTLGEKELSPFFHLVAPPHLKDTLVLARWQDEREKTLVIANVKEIARQLQAIAVLFLGEAWVVTRTAPTSWHQKRVFAEDPPAQQPDRKECVIAAASDGERKIARLWEIVRAAPGGRIISLVETGPLGDGMFSGRLVEGIIVPRRPEQRTG